MPNWVLAIGGLLVSLGVAIFGGKLLGRASADEQRSREEQDAKDAAIRGAVAKIQAQQCEKQPPIDTENRSDFE